MYHILGEAVAGPQKHVANDRRRVRRRRRRARGDGMHLPRQPADVVLDHVEPRRVGVFWLVVDCNKPQKAKMVYVGGGHSWRLRVFRHLCQ